jgi:hypothetical protein
MQYMRHLLRSVNLFVNITVCLLFLTGGVICLWSGFAWGEIGLIVIGMIMTLTGLVGCLGRLRIEHPQLRLISANVTSIFFWMVFFVPVLVSMFSVGIISLFGFFSVGANWNMILVNIGCIAFPLSVLWAFIQSRRSNKSVAEVWEERFLKNSRLKSK